ncbi:MAG TPA: TrmH family RNA methyltransferase [Nitrososphaera sp.]|nr:TrmH family RNA methyltransferase [Nitrososphaera sp.]
MLSSVSVAMVEPQYHVNVGHVARLMKNFGAQELYFISPRFDAEEAIRYAMHGSDVLARARTAATMAELKKKFDHVIGTTAISATSRLNVLRESVSAEQLADIVIRGRGKSFCIVLGREASGMNNKELAECDLVCIVDTKTKYRTMNVAHALAVLLYEISRQGTLPSTHEKKGRPKKPVDLASRQDIDLLLKYIEKLADAGNFDRHKKPLLNAAVKKMVARSQPTTKDAMLLISFLRKGLLAIERNGGEGARHHHRLRKKGSKT